MCDVKNKIALSSLVNTILEKLKDEDESYLILRQIRFQK